MFIKESFMIGLLLFSLNTVAKSTLKFKKNKNAAAWVAKKTMFLVKDMVPVGYNYDIDVTLDKTGKIVVKIPIEKFDSKEPDRDKEVNKILKVNESKSMIFTSKKITEKQMSKLKTQSLEKIKGSLKIGSQKYDVEFALTYPNKNSVYGQFIGKMTSFDIEPPGLLGGLVSKVDDYIELHVQIQLKGILK